MPHLHAIQVPIPPDLEAKNQALFESRTPYSIPKPAIKRLQGAFISYEGLVLHHGQLVKGCAFNLDSKQDKSFYRPFWKLAFEQWAVAKFGKSLPAQHYHKPLVVIHSKWFNYAFWINGYLPRLRMAMQEGLFPEAVLLLPETFRQIPYVMQALQAFDLPIEWLPEGHQAFAKTLYLPECRPYTAAFFPPQMQDTRQWLKDHHLLQNKPPTRRIYLTRKQRGLRCVENENEVLELLKPLGFECISFENLSFAQQIQTMHETQTFVSLHGAGAANLMFMQSGSQFLELINGPYAHTEYTFPFWKLAHAVQVHYQAQFCPIAGDQSKLALDYGKRQGKDTDFLVNQNVVVNLQELERRLQPWV